MRAWREWDKRRRERRGKVFLESRAMRNSAGILILLGSGSFLLSLVKRHSLSTPGKERKIWSMRNNGHQYPGTWAASFSMSA